MSIRLISPLKRGLKQSTWTRPHEFAFKTVINDRNDVQIYSMPTEMMDDDFSRPEHEFQEAEHAPPGEKPQSSAWK